MFAPGRVLTLDINDGRRLDFTVDRLFTPVTKSVVVVARCDELSPSPVVLKIYDPRYNNERNGYESKFGWRKPSHPWSLAAERAAPTTFDPKAIHRPEPAADDLAGQFERAAIWEAHLRHLMEESFWSRYERAAYDNLRDLQGGAIPRLLAASSRSTSAHTCRARSCWNTSRALHWCAPSKASRPTASSIMT